MNSSTLLKVDASGRRDGALSRSLSARRTFAYTDRGPKGLLDSKRAGVVMTSTAKANH